MTRLVLGIVTAALLAACSGAGAPPSGSGEGRPEAEVFKQQMDAEAESLLPELVSALGGTLNGMQATYFERGGFGLWDYIASGTLSRPRGTLSDKLATATVVLERHGYSVDRDDAEERVTATKGDIGVSVQASAPTTDPAVRSLTLRIANVGAIQDGDDFAGRAPPENYLAYLR